jgi:imidazolonepropionase-like amidohydrolase
MENDVRGIPASEVLRMATLTPSQVMGVTKDLGIIAPGKLADLILIDDDPAKNIRDTRNITVVIKGGKVTIRPRSKKPSASHLARWGR